MKPLAIVILNWNKYDYTANCINSIIRHCDKAVFDILLIDNNSTDSSFTKLIQQFPYLTFHRNPGNIGYAGGNNPGLQISLLKGYKYTMVLNNDTAVTEDFLSPLLDFMDNHAKTGAVQPRIMMMYDPSRIWNAGSYFSPYLGLTYTTAYAKKDSARFHSVAKVDWVTGCCFMARNDVLSKIGLFNEAFFLYYEDTDLSFRIRKAGYDLYYIPESFILHAIGISGKSTKKNIDGSLHPMIHYYNVRNKLWVIRNYCRWYHSISIIIFQLVVSIAYLGYFILRWRLKKAVLYLKGIKDGLFLANYKKKDSPSC